MERGVPEASQILFKVHVSVGDQGPVAGSVAGANTALKNPAARYVIDYTADPGTIGLTQNSAGAWQGQITALAIAYDHDGNRLNWVANDVGLALDEATWGADSHNGLAIHQVLDVPAGEVFLRVGLYDPGSGRMGSMEVPLQVAAGK